jgi:hypothetical protein
MTPGCRAATVGVFLLGVCAAGIPAPADGEEPKDAPYHGHGAEPGGTAEAARLAAQEPDEYAWRLFLFINRQALPGLAGLADPRKSSLRDYDDDKDVVWESWALASADGKAGGSEVFLAKGAKPVPWHSLDRTSGAAKMLDRTFTVGGDRFPGLPMGKPGSGKPLPPLFTAGDPNSDEIRMNRSAYETIRDLGLYNLEGLAAAFRNATALQDRDYIQFKSAAKVVKVRWQKIHDANKPRYHWRQINGQTYGLMAFHITTKDLPFWFWCDFIHVDVAAHEPLGSIHDKTTQGPDAPHGKDGIRTATRGSKWENYRLNGSQTAFTDARGRPTKLGNNLLEFPGNVAKSSCITCHAMAGIIKDGTVPLPTPFFTGLPKKGDFGDKEIVRLQTDFLYSFNRAHSTKK